MTHVGKYHLVSKLATGGMAEVFLAKVEGPMGFEKSLVLKRILPHLAVDPQFVGMFFTEARVAAQLNHPNVVQIFDFGQASGTYYIAMEYIDGPDLRTLSRRAAELKQPLSPAFCARIISAACEGLSYAHDFVDPASGSPLDLIHRDISPDNILVSRQGTVKVVDFGIAKAANQRHKTNTGLIKGKIAYMPPEQLHGQELDRRVDVYAMGVVLYELLTGRYPFEANTDVSMMQAILFEPLVSAAARRPELPEALVKILDRALCKVREQRYPDCIALQADLELFVRSTGESVGPRDIAQGVERLYPKSAEPVRPELPPSGTDMVHREAMETEAGGFASTAISSRFPSVESRAVPDEQDAEEAAPVRQQPPATGASLAATSARPSSSMLPASASASRHGRARLGLAFGGLALVAVGSALVIFREHPVPSAPPAVAVVGARGGARGRRRAAPRSGAHAPARGGGRAPRAPARGAGGDGGRRGEEARAPGAPRGEAEAHHPRAALCHRIRGWHGARADALGAHPGLARRAHRAAHQQRPGQGHHAHHRREGRPAQHLQVRAGRELTPQRPEDSNWVSSRATWAHRAAS